LITSWLCDLITGACTDKHLATVKLKADPNRLSIKRSNSALSIIQLLLALFHSINSPLLSDIFLAVLFPKSSTTRMWLIHRILSHPIMPLLFHINVNSNALF
jgi:hypothetical protein